MNMARKKSMNKDAAAATTTATADQPTTRKKQDRRTKKFLLVRIDHTEPEIDANGNPVPGTSQEVFVPMEFPAGLDEGQLRVRDAIKRACRRAVYDRGVEKYGNIDLAVISYDEIFRINCTKQTVTKLVPTDGD